MPAERGAPHPASSLALPGEVPSESAFPRRFGDYLLVCPLAEGGMAEVFLARHRRGGVRWQAIKCLRPKLARQERFQQMFDREARLALLLDHPNVVRSREAGAVDGQWFIAMDYVAGQDLSALLRRCRAEKESLPIELAVHLAMMISRGLHYAHSLVGPQGRPLHVVNRDVSPANVRVSYDGEVKLLDFGIAQAALALTSEIGVVKGKLPYMSPEQIRGLPLDRRSDVYSTGVVLHEMLTGRRLFAEESEFELRERVRQSDVAPPSTLNPEVPQALDATVMRALEREPSERFADAAALEAVLAPYTVPDDEARASLATLVQRLFPEAYRAEPSRRSEAPLPEAPRRAPPAAPRASSAVVERAPEPRREPPAPPLADPDLPSPLDEGPSLWIWLTSAALLLTGAGLLYWASRTW
ncbi:MAG: serine/threonine protein kinase [Deltaproteobacteria bacterium]|nr:serine/threonine protein kinase [Deltaproteobacteria bacterium]